MLLHGGGNLGDLYARERAFREQVFRDFRDHRVIEFPQSIHFRRPQELEKTRRLIDGMQDYTLIARDRSSFELAEAKFDCSIALAPDAAFALGPIERPPPRRRAVILAREDIESAGLAAAAKRADLPTVDWHMLPRRQRVRWRVARLPLKLQSVPGATSPFSHPVQRLVTRSLNHLAESNLQWGAAMLGDGERVLTDRLHAHILCELMSIPHIIVDNGIGKLRAFYDTWTSNSELAHWSDSTEDALEMLVG